MTAGRVCMVAALVGTTFCLPGRTVLADDDDRPGPTSQAVASLDEQMSAMQRDFRTLRRQIKDPSQNASTLAALADLEQHTVTAKSIVPHSATTMPSAPENAAKLADYRSTMLKLLQQEVDLEEQLIANNNDKAAETLGAIGDTERAGHKEFRPRRRD